MGATVMDGGLPCRPASMRQAQARALDDLLIERCGPDTPAPLEPSDARVLLAVPETGAVDIVAEGCVSELRVGTAALLARPGAAKASWAPNAHGYLLHIPRRRLQAALSRLSGEPTRFRAVNLALDLPPSDGTSLAQLFREIWAEPSHDVAAGRLHANRVITAVIAALQEHTPRPWGVAQSVKRALACFSDQDAADFSAERLAAAAGVTERTLRTNFLEVLGRPLPVVVQVHRLQWARDRLASARDSRSIEAFAAAAGFRSPAAFTRAYRRAFGESPMVTRARSVRNAQTP